MSTPDHASISSPRTGRHVGTLTAMALAITVIAVLLAPAARAQSDEASDDGFSFGALDPLVDGALVPNVLVPAGDLLAPIGNETGGLLFDDNYHSLSVPLGPNLWLPNIAAQHAATASELLLDALSVDADTYSLGTFWADNSPEFGTNSVYATGTEGVPVPVDLSGNGLYDISVEVRHLGTTPVLRVLRLPGAQSPLRTSVSVSFAPFGDSAPDRVHLTLDAQDFPALAQITLIEPGFETNQLVAEVRSVDPGNSLYVVARYDDGSPGDGVSIEEVLSPVPGEVILNS